MELLKTKYKLINKIFLSNRSFVSAFIILSCLSSCKNFLDIGPPKSSLVNETVFNTDNQAISAINGVYSLFQGNNNFASGGLQSITRLAGASADEFIGYSSTNRAFYQNNLTSSFTTPLYSSPYKSIYAANSIIEGLEGSQTITQAIKTQLLGEAYFIRAFSYFYLVNMFGNVPIHLTTDYKVTSIARKSTSEDIYKRIIDDLLLSETLLSDDYPTPSRSRANRCVVQAMLARTYLYLKDWDNAEKYASLIISKSHLYSLVNYDQIFLANSNEAIWQIVPEEGKTTFEGQLGNIAGSGGGAPTDVSLSNSFINDAFDPGDMRLNKWIVSETFNSTTYYYPYKYKIIEPTSPTIEYSTVLRLSEQYLIRSEARINKGNTQNGIEDLNIVRLRQMPGGINANTVSPISNNLDMASALNAVARERRVELFSEWGHRWFDLKRTGKASTVLGPVKPNWKATAVLYPIPQAEILTNPNITQNEGY